MSLEEAVALARRFRGGTPGNAAVLQRLSTDQQKLVAVLHDLLRNSELSSTDLMAAGCPRRALQAIDTLTRRSDESYDQFLVRAATDPLARAVTLAGLDEASDPDGRSRAIVARTKAIESPSSHYRMGEVDDAPPGPWARFDCGACGHPAGRAEVRRGDSGAWAVVTSLLGWAAARIEPAGTPTIEAAVGASDGSTLCRFELAPFWCPDCEQAYCHRHWTTEVVMDEGFYDCTYGTCPQGHRVMIDD